MNAEPDVRLSGHGGGGRDGRSWGGSSPVEDARRTPPFSSGSAHSYSRPIISVDVGLGLGTDAMVAMRLENHRRFVHPWRAGKLARCPNADDEPGRAVGVCQDQDALESETPIRIGRSWSISTRDGAVYRRHSGCSSGSRNPPREDRRPPRLQDRSLILTKSPGALRGCRKPSPRAYICWREIGADRAEAPSESEAMAESDWSMPGSAS